MKYRSDGETMDEDTFNATMLSIKRLLPTGFEPTMAISRSFPRGELPTGKRGDLVRQAFDLFEESTILPLMLIPKQRGVRGLICVGGPIDSLYTIDASSPALADRELLIAWLIVSGNLDRKTAEQRADKMRG